jgi:hypothetical protein
VHPEQPQTAELGGGLARELTHLEPLVDVREDAIADELPDAVADHPLFGAQEGTDVQEVDRVRRRHG